MKHEFQNSRVYLMDCIEGMKQYQDKHFELAIVDPPYGINITAECMGGRKTVEPDKTKIWDIEVPTQEYFDQLFRISENQVIWGGNYFQLPVSRYFAIWDKGETMYGRDFAECEYAWVRSGGTRIYKKNPNQPERIHPTQKPVALYEWLIHNYAKQGDKILDTHLGSQSSRIAAYKNGFDFTAFETDAEYFDKGNKRFDEFKSQLRIF
jgi:site-specific DNA-methyltransferase (adenine-specific)